jgi:hypothetical protein
VIEIKKHVGSRHPVRSGAVAADQVHVVGQPGGVHRVQVSAPATDASRAGADFDVGVAPVSQFSTCSVATRPAFREFTAVE